MERQSDNEHVKEVYARFGLAIYHAQVLEHGIVNALAILDLVPSRMHTARSRAEWAKIVDQFMSRHFETTMGQLMKSLRSVTVVHPELENLMRDSLKKRNWLAHDFFRDCSSDFITFNWREKMLKEIFDCNELFSKTDKYLDESIRPLREKYGITDAFIERETNKIEEEQIQKENGTGT